MDQEPPRWQRSGGTPRGRPGWLTWENVKFALCIILGYFLLVMVCPRFSPLEVTVARVYPAGVDHQGGVAQHHTEIGKVTM